MGIAFLEIDGVRHLYTVKPIEFFDKNEPNKNKWVITVESPFTKNAGAVEFISDEEVYELNIRLWQEEMNVTPILVSAFAYAYADDISLRDLEDPLVKQTFDNNPDMEARIERFTTGEMGALSEPGIVLLTNTFYRNDLFR